MARGWSFRDFLLFLGTGGKIHRTLAATRQTLRILAAGVLGDKPCGDGVAGQAHVPQALDDGGAREEAVGSEDVSAEAEYGEKYAAAGGDALGRRGSQWEVQEGE